MLLRSAINNDNNFQRRLQQELTRQVLTEVTGQIQRVVAEEAGNLLNSAVERVLERVIKSG